MNNFTQPRKTLKRTIFDMFAENPDRAYTVDEITLTLNRKRSVILDYIWAMTNEGTVKKLDSGHFARYQKCS